MALSFDDMFYMTTQSFLIVGLGDFHLEKSRNSALFQISQWLYLIIGYGNLVPTVICEFLWALFSDKSDFASWIFQASELGTCFLVSTMALVKVMTLIVMRKTIVRLVAELRAMWVTDDEDPEIRKVLLDNMEPTKKLLSIYGVMTNCLGMLYNLFSPMNMLVMYISERKTELILPYNIWYPFNTTSSVGVYCAVFYSQFWAGIFTAAGMVSFDCLFCLLVAILSMNFSILCYKFQKMSNSSVNNSKAELNEYLAKLISEHNNLIRIGRDLETVFRFPLLVNLVGVSLLVCLLLFSITIAPIARMIKYCIFLCSTLIQIAMMSGYGNMLIEKSELVANAVYHSDWQELGDAKHNKTVMMLLVRAQQPVGISAMGFTVLSLQTLTSILSASWSYFTLLRTVYIREK